MKLSVSLSEEDVRFLDEYAAQQAAPSRSAAIHQAIDLLRAVDLEDAYESAWTEPGADDDAELWDTVSADGLADAAR